MKIGRVGQENLARAVLGGMGVLFTGAGMATMSTAPHPGLKLFGAGFATIGAGLLALAGTGNFKSLESPASLASQSRLGLGREVSPDSQAVAA
ncbi:MAG: hypothetical protein A3B68_09870 [Candidatus Melainabacteria bacterium RIFCSPHIGHO2_02_FULL_34_12]|nr:MAG: hypothetical protein A3B68_09870 [Candidatus Melainabacteria bacterium RIFCSPHIGHO2_02_FULL_34_12]